MTLQDVTSRIASIQQQLAMLAPTTTASTAASARTASSTGLDTTASTGTTFSQALDGVLAGGASATSDLPETGSLSDLVGTGTQSSDAGAAVVSRAQSYLGVPYVWGGTDPAKGLDCSGLVQRVYRDLGIELPRVSRDQATVGTAVAGLDQAQPGDLLAFGSPVHHIAIYVGDGKMIEAPRPGLDVRVADVSDTPSAIRRVIGSDIDTRTASVGSVAGSSAVSGVASSTPYADLFSRAASTYGIDAGLLAAVAKQESDALVVGADSVLEFRGQPLGKPTDAADAVLRWRRMSGRSGVLHTGQALLDVHEGAVVRRDVAVSSTTVHFAVPTEAEIEAYVGTGEPLQVAGAFTLDGLGAPFVRRVEGDPTAVIGLSLPLLRVQLGRLGLTITDFWDR